jgi:hypothetical protein
MAGQDAKNVLCVKLISLGLMYDDVQRAINAPNVNSAEQAMVWIAENPAPAHVPEPPEESKTHLIEEMEKNS